MQLVESYATEADTEIPVVIDDEIIPVPALVEDEEGFRYLLLGACQTIPVRTWVKAYESGACALLARDPGGAWLLLGVQKFIADRTELSQQAAYGIPSGWVAYPHQEWTFTDLVGYFPPEMFTNDTYTKAELAQETSTVEGRFVSLHTHTEYSALDGFSRIQEMVDFAVADGQGALAGSDHGNCASHPELQTICQAAGIKPIFGMEAYFVADRHRRPKKWTEMEDGKEVAKSDTTEVRDYQHMTLWAMTDAGLRNLWAMSTEAFREGFYYYPRLDWETLERLNEGVIASTGCLRGPLAQAIMAGDDMAARMVLGRLLDIFDDRLYIELHTNTLPDQVTVNKASIGYAMEYNIPLIACTDSHYTHHEDAQAHHTWLAVQTNKDVTEDSSLFGGAADYFMHTADEVEQALSYLPTGVVAEAMANTVVVANRCTASISGVPTAPTYSKGENAIADDERRLREICETNWAKKAVGRRDSEEIYRARFEREMDLLVRKQFCGYFLVVEDYVSAAKREGILAGPCRGCLTGDTPVRTEHGLVSLADVRIGDRVVTHTGSILPVTATHRYEIDESLIKIRSYYDDASGITMTRDHKVLVEKAAPVTNRKLVSQGYRWLPPTGVVGWIAAEEIEVGDLVVTPVPEVSVTDRDVIDLAEYVDDRCEIHADHLVEYHRTNDAFPYSQRDIHRRTGLSRNTILAAVRNVSTVQQSTYARIMDVLGDEFLSIEQWRRYLIEHQQVRISIPRFVEVDSDFCTLMGMLVSNGWLRKDDLAEVGVAVRRSKNDDSPLDLFSKVWGLNASRADHGQTDLTQYRIQSRIVRRFYVTHWPHYNYRAQSKALPSWMMRLPAEKRMAALRGLWWGDGSHRGTSTYSTTSALLRDQVRDLLWGLGLPAGVRRELRDDDRPGWEATDRESWTILTTPGFVAMRNQHGWTDGQRIYTRVWKIAPAYSEPVYDITVDRDHSYATSSFTVHNSGGGSLVAYLAGIEEIDPIYYDLMFERFLTEGRNELPDFDMDFPASKRDWIKDYLRKRWGEDNAISIGTQLRLQSKGAIDSAQRALKPVLRTPVDYNDLKLVSKIIDEIDRPLAGKHTAWEDLWTQFGELLGAYRDKYPEIFTAADQMVGRLKSYGKHAAGMVISTDRPLTDLPLRLGDDGFMVTQFDMNALAELGYVKFDLLTLRTLDTIQVALDEIERRYGKRINLYELQEELDDPEIWDQVSDGHTLGIFQIETAAGTKLTKQLRPASVDDLAIIGAIVRPGPMRSGLTDMYLRRRAGNEVVTYPDPRMESFLKTTFGCIIFQEQILATTMTLAGYDETEADGVRKILGKKLVEKIGPAGQEFKRRAVECGTDVQVAESLWAQMEEFARYSFGKAHSYGYALIGTWTAWLKFHFEVEFMTAVLSTVDDDRIPDFVRETRRLGYRVLPPDINISGVDFSSTTKGVRYGLSSVKGVGKPTAQKIVARQPYESIERFQEASGANSLITKTLAAVGSFDSLYPNRRALESQLDWATSDESTCCQHKIETCTGPGGLPCGFDWAAEIDPPMVRIPKKDQIPGGPTQEPKPPPKRCTVACRNYTPPEPLQIELIRPYTADDIINREKELLGVYLTSTPFDRIDPEDLKTLHKASEIEAGPYGRYITVGLVNRIRPHTTKSGNRMAFLGILAQDGDLDVAVFPEEYAKHRQDLATDALLVMVLRKAERGLVLDDLAPA